MKQRSAVAFLSIILATLTAAHAAPRRHQQPQHVAPAVSGDKRDRIIASSGTPFHGKAYWQAAAQCGGFYFKIGTLYSEGAIRAKVVKPDPAAYASLQKSADTATRTATAFFEAAEHFLIADRKMTRDEAVLTYDAVATTAGEHVKALDTSAPVLKPCPDFYQACRMTYPQMCNDKAVLTH